VTFQLLGNRWALEGHARIEDYSVRKETLAIEACFEKAQLSGPYDVVAHSAGGCFALDFALRNPSSIRSLTLIEPSLAWVLRDAGALDADLRDYIARRMKHYHTGITEKQYARFILETMAINTSVDPRKSPYWPDVAAYRENMKFRPALYKHRDRVGRLKDIRFPVLLVGGRNSDRFHQRTIETLESLIPRSRSIVMRGGHAPHLGRGLVPFMRHLSRFLAQAPKPAKKSRFPG
jgi:pimeloyl-ACP methyl ester carboxylesterase